MNKTQQLLQKRSELFDKEFRTGEKAWQPNYELIKSFHATTISLLLTSLKEESEKLSRVNFGAVLEERRGEYVKLSDISTLLSETISNIQTK